MLGEEAKSTDSALRCSVPDAMKTFILLDCEDEEKEGRRRQGRKGDGLRGGAGRALTANDMRAAEQMGYEGSGMVDYIVAVDNPAEVIADRTKVFNRGWRIGSAIVKTRTCVFGAL